LMDQSTANDRRLSISKLEGLLKTHTIANPPQTKVELWDSIDSTNSRAMALAAEGAPGGMLVVAREQTAGRGRLGRQWTSPPDSGIYASFLLRPNAALLPNLSAITLGAGVAAADAIEAAAGVKVGLKWVNDLVLNGKKLGGILAEMSNRDGKPALVIGIGINISLEREQVPGDLRAKLTWLEEVTQQAVDANVMLAQLCLSLERIYDLMLDNQVSTILDQWRKRSVTLGKHVRAKSGDKEWEGIAEDIAQSGALLLRTSNGVQELHAGEISIRAIDGSYS
jgi:BirA family biotin operon repressor/biotin-[acetyl-CoA-carboxylase] ligase